MKRTRLYDPGTDASAPVSPAAPAGLFEREIVSTSGLYVYKHRLSGFPPAAAERQRFNRFLSLLIPKLMVMTSRRLEPYIFLDGRFFSDDRFQWIQQTGVAWRALLGFPVIPGYHPFRYLPIAFHIQNRSAWNEIAPDVLGTGGIAIYLTGLPADEFFTRMQQLSFTQDERGQTQLRPLYLPEAALCYMKTTAAPNLKPFLECVEFFIGENPADASLEVVGRMAIDDMIQQVMADISV